MFSPFLDHLSLLSVKTRRESTKEKKGDPAFLYIPLYCSSVFVAPTGPPLWPGLTKAGKGP